MLDLGGAGERNRQLPYGSIEEFLRTEYGDEYDESQEHGQAVAHGGLKFVLSLVDRDFCERFQAMPVDFTGTKVVVALSRQGSCPIEEVEYYLNQRHRPESEELLWELDYFLVEAADLVWALNKFFGPVAVAKPALPEITDHLFPPDEEVFEKPLTRSVEISGIPTHDEARKIAGTIRRAFGRRARTKIR